MLLPARDVIICILNRSRFIRHKKLQNVFLHHFMNYFKFFDIGYDYERQNGRW